MTDPLSITSGIVGVIGLTIQITQAATQFGLDWKDAPHDVKVFKTELQTLATTLLATSNLATSDYAEAFQNRSSFLLSELGPNAPSTTDAKMMLEICEKELKDMLRDLEKRAKGHRVGWERMKGVFLAKRTRESIENLHRWCQDLNNLVSIDTAVLGAYTHREVKEALREHQEARIQQQKWHESEESQRILTWLASVEYGPQQSDLLSRQQPGTGDWLLQLDEFQGWCDGQRQTLFCPGMPGAGKTIMTSVVVDYLGTKYQNATDVSIAYLYCNFRRKDEQKPVDLLASLLKQLLLGLPKIPESVTRLYEYHRGRRTRPLFDDISKELHAVANSYSKCFIIVDALDECQVTDGGRRKLLSELFDLQTKAPASLFATSRFIPEIANEFTGKCASIEIHASDQDVRRYLDGQMTQLPSFVLRNAGLQEEIKTEIVNAVQGMFLLAQLHLNSLAGSKSPKTLRSALRELPKGSNAYDHAYKEAMDRIQGQIANSRDLAQQVLSWITCAKRPLTTLELRYALAVEIDETELDETNLPETEDIVSVCAGLVTIDGESNIIRLVHYTTQEFFERTWKEWFPNAQDSIATSCVTYLSFDAFESGFCSSDKEFEDRLGLYPLYDYAARNWGHHCRENTDAQYSIPKFFGSEAKTSCCSQALMVSTGYRYTRYSQAVPQQMTAVHLAAWFGLSKTVEILLENGYDSDNKNSYHRTPLWYAVANGHETVVKLLTERDDVETDSKNQDGQTPLSHAAANGHETVVKLLMERDDVETDSKDRRGRTPLSHAAANGHETVVRLLMERDDVEMDSKNQYGRTPLSHAAANGHETVVRLLMERDDVEMDSKNQYGQTPLSHAAANGHETVVKLLMERDDVEVDSKDQDGRTPLTCAAWSGHEAVVRLLVERDDVEADSKDQYGRTPLTCAAWNGHEAVVKLLVERDDVEADSKDQYGQTPLSHAAWSGHETVVRLLMERDDVEVDSKDRRGRTPLSHAAWSGHETVVRLLMERDDVEMDSKNQYGRTPLSHAAWNGHETVVRLLMERDDVETDSKNQDGQTPLSHAAANGHETVVKLLMERDDVEVDSKDQDGRTPLSHAAWSGHETVVKLLVERDDVEADSKDRNGLRPLSHAAGDGHEAVVKLLVERDDVEADSKDQYGRTPLSWAATGKRFWPWSRDQNYEAVLELLLMQDLVDVNSTDIDDRTTLSLAAKEGYYTRVKLLLAKDGIDGDIGDADGRTPLSWVAARGHDSIITLLFAMDGINPNCRDRYGQTPLLLAAGNGHEVAVKSFLAENVVDFESRDNFGRTPLTWAAKKGHINVVESLRQKYRECGLVIPDEDLEIAMPSAPDSKDRLYCSICLAWIPDIKAHYHCGICSRGDFDLCEDCFMYGAFCIDRSHQLTKRMVEGVGFVDMTDESRLQKFCRGP